MNKLVIEQKRGERQECTYLGWRDDALAFYGLCPAGRPVVIEPVPAYPGDWETGEPYRFPRLVPVEITPEQFREGWSAEHLEVIRRWRDAKLAEVPNLGEEELFPFSSALAVTMQ